MNNVAMAQTNMREGGGLEDDMMMEGGETEELVILDPNHVRYCLWGCMHVM